MLYDVLSLKELALLSGSARKQEIQKRREQVVAVCLPTPESRKEHSASAAGVAPVIASHFLESRLSLFLRLPFLS